MFKREHHIQIATILQALDASLLLSHGCYFGGGTAIALSHQEYRESVDIDFLVSDIKGYRALRQLVTGKGGIKAIARSGTELTPMRDVRADQYGIRTMLRVADTEIKFEIVLENRIELEEPRSKDHICGVTTLTPLDMATTKLLANSDRWADDSVYSRDLIDLAMLEPSPAELARAIEKAAQAYGKSIKRDLSKAIQKLRDRPARLDECMEALKISNVPKALLWKRIRILNPKKAEG